MIPRRVPPLALRLALVPIVATVPGTTAIVYAYGEGWPGGVVVGCLFVAVLPMITMWLAVDGLVVRPLGTVRHALDRLTDGDFSARTGARGDGEFQVVMRALDDLAGRLDARLALARAAEERYRLLVEHNPAGMFRTREADGRVLDCNPAAVRMLGYASAVEMKSHRATDFYADPADRHTLIETVRASKGAVTFELRMRRKDGAELPVIIGVVRGEHMGEPCLEGQFVPLPVLTSDAVTSSPS
jgi:PAS domain S-box-containing protein